MFQNKGKGKLHSPDITVDFGITAVVVGSVWCAWCLRNAAGDAVLMSQGSTDLVVIVTWGATLVFWPGP